MNASDVMTTDLIVARPDHSVREVAELLLKNRISAVPVVDAAGKLVGIVSEGDLVRRAMSNGQWRRSWWLEWLSGDVQRAAAYAEAHGNKVLDIMTRQVITAAPGATLPEIARLLESNNIKRVPIVKAGKLVGIVSRANLIGALAGPEGEKTLR